MARRPSLTWHERNHAWRANVGPYGKAGRRKPVYFREIADTAAGRRKAEAALDDYLRERDRREAAGIVDGSNPTVEQVVESYLEHAEAMVGRGELEPRTYQTHAERLGTFMDFSPTGLEPDRFIGRRAREMRAADLLRMVRAMVDRDASAHYVNGVLRSAKACWAWASRPVADRTPERILESDPFRDVRGPKIPRGAERYATRAEVAAVIRAAWRDAGRWKVMTKGRCARCMTEGREGPCRRGHNLANLFGRATAAMLRLAYHSGCRPGELCKATWGDFRPEPVGGAGAGLVVLQKHKSSGTTGKPRVIVVPPLLVRALQRWRGSEAAVAGGHIFGHPRGRNWREAGADLATVGVPWNSTALGAPVRRWRRVAGVREDVTLYMLRHTWASDALMFGQTGAVAGEAIGTSERMIEAHYGHILAARVADSSEAVRLGRRGRR